MTPAFDPAALFAGRPVDLEDLSRLEQAHGSAADPAGGSS